jgi:outer membrane protein TolC
MKQRILRITLWVCSKALAMGQAPLELADVMAMVEQNYPPLLATLAERDIADAEVTQALGRFDLMLAAQADVDRFGYYENERLNAGFDQPLANLGGSFYGGWRYGDGNFPLYAGQSLTRSGGEWRGGVRIPLLKNREIDDRRGNLTKARIGTRLADLTINQQRLAVRQMAARRYWDWVAAGQRLKVAKEILRVANERDAALREAAELGQIPAIEVTENTRQILQRQSLVVEAERALQQAAIELSLFYRDTNGQPVLALPEQLPPMLPGTMPLSDEQVSEDLETALLRRPEIERQRQQAEQNRVDIRLARNDAKPAVDLSVGFTSEAGQGLVLRGPSELKASVRFEVPFQRRGAQGKLAAAEAKLTQAMQREAYARDQVEAEVRDAASAVRNAHNRALLIRQEVNVALDLADAERERFRLGDSTLFTVNLREQAAVDAEMRSVGAVGDYLRALTIYEQVTAKALTP